MAPGKEEKKDDTGKDKTEGKEEKKKDGNEVITAIYRVNLHCQECGSKIKKHLMTTQGVQNADIDMDKGEIKAKGKLDPLKILNLIEKKSKKKVELISPKLKPKESTATDKKPMETKDPIIRTISVKVHMHCDKCEADLKQRLMKHKGIFNVKTDKKAQSVSVEGTIEAEKLLSFMRKRVHKNAVVISIKEAKTEEKKEKGKEEGKPSETNKDKNESKSGESTKKKDDSKPGESTKEKEGKSIVSTKEKEDGKSGETTKTKENVPYIIHYVYAPQLFSDENPNSCSIM